ncbi:hypothetical protein BD779DRAFT_1667625 [Infundibulicybe gibba]|nr:hypothetical protein BD779DRAFT_1667625 [Infundibulicybe gibba]
MSRNIIDPNSERNTVKHRDTLLGSPSNACSFNPTSAHSLRPARRPAFAGFIPLPPITASPICTPSLSMDSRNFPSYAVLPAGAHVEINAAHSPPKLARRSVACMTHRPSSPITPSTSFPASLPPHHFLFSHGYDFSAPLLIRAIHKLGTQSIVQGEPPSLTKAIMHGEVNGDDEQATSRRSRHIFHIPHEVISDNEDNGPNLSHHSNEEMSGEGSDSVRKYYALMELLTTEVGYLQDLKVLVTIYLHNLPTLACRPPTLSSSFASSPWINSYAHIYAPSPSAAVLAESMGTEILDLHEHFVEELREAMSPLGFPVTTCENENESEQIQKDRIHHIDAAVRIVSTKFAAEASRFNLYQKFCTGHPEALDLVRKTHRQHPSEWESFEQRCSSMVGANDVTPEAPKPQRASSDKSQSSTVKTESDPKRTVSMTSIDSAVRTLRIRASGVSSFEPLAFPASMQKEKSGPRLSFLDYLIKPVQRICKYPLLLDQLRQGAFVRVDARTDVDVVQSAAQAMRHVATSVDEARHRQDVAVQTSLIASRILLATPATGISSMTASTFHILTPSFLASLGICLLAGPLDVIHCCTSNPPGITSNLKAKYLGVFLYYGGYMLLAKVSKGKVYEPRHWFSLSQFEIFDIESDEAMLPCSFRISCLGHELEFAAACQREKDVWLDCIRESLTCAPAWTNEPTPSLKFENKDSQPASPIDNGPHDHGNALPTIQSIPELTDGSNNLEQLDALVSSQSPKPRSKKRKERNDSLPPSRRSSTASVKAIFSPMVSDSETVVIRRSSMNARSHVDEGLRDIISQQCLTARSYASRREDELFQGSKNRMGFTRSNSGASMAGIAKNRLSRHESVRVRRRGALLDSADTNHQNRHTLSKARSMMIGRSPTGKLSITSISESDALFMNRSTHPPPSPYSQSSSKTSSPISPISSPSRNSTPPRGATVDLTPDSYDIPMKTTRSLRGLFYSRTNHPTTPNTNHNEKPTSTDPEPPTKISTPNTLKRWAMGSLHRRTRSAPDVPENLLSPPSNIEAPSPSGRRKSLLSPAFQYSTAKTDIPSLLQRLKA